MSRQKYIRDWSPVWNVLFQYELDWYSDNDYTTNTFHVCIVPPCPMLVVSNMVRNRELIMKLSKNISTNQFGTPDFIQCLKQIESENKNYKIQCTYRISAMLLLVDQRKKIFHITKDNAYIPTGTFIPKDINEWYQKHVDRLGSDHVQKMIDRIKDQSYSFKNVMLDVDMRFNYADMMMLFNDSNTFLGFSYAYIAQEERKNVNAMIGLRSSISRVFSCGKNSPVSIDKCANGNIGTILFAMRCLLAKIDCNAMSEVIKPPPNCNSMTAQVRVPIGEMKHRVQDSKFKDIFEGKEPFTYDILREMIPNSITDLRIPTWREYLTQHDEQVYNTATIVLVPFINVGLDMELLQVNTVLSLLTRKKRKTS